MAKAYGGRRIWLALSILLVGALLAGSTTTAAVGKLVIWSSEAQLPALQEMAKKFQAEFGVPVQVTEVSFGEIRPNFSVAAPTGEGPDLIVGAHDWIGELAKTGLLEPIALSAAEREAFARVAIDAFTLGGKLYGVPYAIEAIAIIYNKALVPRVPATWDEFIKLARGLTDREKKRYGFLYPTGDPYHSFPFLSAKGGFIFKFGPQGFDANVVGIDSPGGVAGARLIESLTKEGLVPKGTDYQTMQGLFTQGNVGMIMTGPWEIDNVKRAGINYGVAKIPTIEGRTARPFVGAQGFMLNSFSQNKVLALEFLRKFVMTRDGQLAIWKVDPRIPALNAAYQAVSTDPDVRAFGASAADGIPMPNIPQMAAVWGALGDKLTLVVNGEQDPASAMRDAARQIRDAIARGK